MRRHAMLLFRLLRAIAPIALTALAAACTTSRDAPASSGPRREEDRALSQAVTQVHGRETEAQWETDEPTFERLFLEVQQGMYSMRSAPQWGDLSARKYEDDYYDTPHEDLAALGDAFRHRRRFAPAAPVEIVGASDALDHADWQPTSDSIQYKSDPVEDGAIWSRAKRGNSKLTHEQAMAALTCRDDPFAPGDDPFALLRARHPGADCASLVARERCVQYRMHFLLFSEGRRRPHYHIALDRVRVPGSGGPSTAFLVELEPSRPWLASGGKEALRQFVDLARQLQTDFSLRPLRRSKRQMCKGESP